MENKITVTQNGEEVELDMDDFEKIPDPDTRSSVKDIKSEISRS